MRCICAGTSCGAQPNLKIRSMELMHGTILAGYISVHPAVLPISISGRSGFRTTGFHFRNYRLHYAASACRAHERYSVLWIPVRRELF